MPKNTLSPFGNIVDRALREAFPGVTFALYMTRKLAYKLRESLVSYMMHHDELPIQEFGKFERKRVWKKSLNGRIYCTVELVFTPSRALTKGEKDEI